MVEYADDNKIMMRISGRYRRISNLLHVDRKMATIKKLWNLVLSFEM
jgi:hypothetical protein